MRRNDLKAEIVRRGLRQHQVARYLGFEPSALNMYLNGSRRFPPGLEQRVLMAIDVLARAEAAAVEARRRVLATAKAEADEARRRVLDEAGAV